MRKVSMGGRTSRVAAGVIAALALSLFTFGGQAAAWSAPTLRAACAPDSTHYAWTITLGSESNFKIDESWNSPFSGATTANFSAAGTHSFTTARGGGKLYVRWTSDHGVTANATANGTPCGGTTNGTECTGTANDWPRCAPGFDSGGTASVTFTMSNGLHGQAHARNPYGAIRDLPADTASQQESSASRRHIHECSFTSSVGCPAAFFQVDHNLDEHGPPARTSTASALSGANGGMTSAAPVVIGTTTDTTGSNTSTTASTVTTTTGHAVVRRPNPSSSGGAVGIVTLIVALPGGSNQLPPSSAQSVQTSAGRGAVRRPPVDQHGQRSDDAARCTGHRAHGPRWSSPPTPGRRPSCRPDLHESACARGAPKRGLLPWFRRAGRSFRD